MSRHLMSIAVTQSADGTLSLRTSGDPTHVEIVALAEFAQMLAKSQFFDSMRAAEAARSESGSSV